MSSNLPPQRQTPAKEQTMDFDTWQRRHGPSSAPGDIEQQRAGWDAREPQVQDLVVLVRRLAAELHQARPDSQLPATATNFLLRSGYNSRPLR